MYLYYIGIIKKNLLSKLLDDKENVRNTADFITFSLNTICNLYVIRPHYLYYTIHYKV